MTVVGAERLRQQIADGFRDARPPATHDEIADDWEVPEARALVGKHWSDVPLELIRRVHWDLEWFRRPGIRHYLPALLLAALHDAEIAETVIAYLGRAWLRWLRDERHDQDAAKALAAYWDDPRITPLDEERVRLFRRAGALFAPDRAPREVTELAAAVTRALEDDDSGYRRPVFLRSPDDAEPRAALASTLTTDQLAFVVDLVEYSRRRRPDADDDATLRFWRTLLAARRR